jgi:hypothetical protein
MKTEIFETFSKYGCFHNGPVICPKLVIMAQGRLYWPEAIFEVIKHTF